MEFEIGHDDDGKVKAVSVTAPGGGPCFGPRKSRPNPRRRDGRAARSNSGAEGSARGPPKPKDPFWHESLDESVKSMLEEKGVRTSTGTIDVSIAEARVKLGTNGYSSMAHADGILAEGKFTCDDDGNAAFTWEHCITCDKAAGTWGVTEDKSTLLSGFCLADGKLCVANTICTNSPMNIETNLDLIFLLLDQLMYFPLELTRMHKLSGVTFLIRSQLWRRAASRCVMSFLHPDAGGK